MLGLILMMHQDTGDCGQMIANISTPRLTNVAQTGATPGMQAVSLVTQKDTPTAKRGLNKVMNGEMGPRRKNARGGHGSRSSPALGPPKGGGAT